MSDPFFSLAQTSAERDEVFRLRYDCYRRAGAIPPNPERRFRDDFDDLPNQFSFFSGSSAEAAATVRISTSCGPGLATSTSQISSGFFASNRTAAFNANS
jgi:hypothetical protein